MTGQQGCRVRAARRPRPARALSSLTALAMLGACAQVPDAVNPVEWYKGARDWVVGEDKPDDTAKGAEKPMPGADKPFPELSSVPERPTAVTSEKAREQAAEERKRAARSLAADRERARYTDDVIRRQTDPEPEPRRAVVEAPEPTVPAAPSVPPPPAAAAPPAVAAVPPAPAPAPMTTPLPPAPMTTPLPPAPAQTSPPPAPVFNAPTPVAPPVRARPPSSEFSQLSFGPPPADIAPFQAGVAAPLPSGPQAIRRTRSRIGQVPAGGPRLDSTVLTTVNFANGSARLGPRALATVRRAYQAWRARGGVLRVVGHASSRTANMDPVRHRMVNFNVSVDRANAVARALIRLGANPEAVLVDAVSDSQPRYFEVMPSGEAGNRRTEIHLER